MHVVWWCARFEQKGCSSSQSDLLCIDTGFLHLASFSLSAHSTPIITLLPKDKRGQPKGNQNVFFIFHLAFHFVINTHIDLHADTTLNTRSWSKKKKTICQASNTSICFYYFTEKNKFPFQYNSFFSVRNLAS